MSRSVVAILALILTLGYVQVYWATKGFDSTTPLLARKIESLKQDLARSELRETVRMEELREFRQDVASLLPESLKFVTQKEQDYPMRTLASVMVKSTGENVRQIAAASLFETGKVFFKKGEYEKSNRLFRKLIDSYGYATQAVEAYFLLAEGQYQLGDLDMATETINQIVEVFPESELTGFSVLRLGNILESRDRFDESVQLYRMVLKTFPYRSVASEAEKNLRQMEP